jgi:hypothetical protein
VNASKHIWIDSQVLALMKSQNSDDPEYAIKSLCKQLIDEAGIDDPPFKPEVLASFRGVKTVQRLPIKEAGRLIPLPNGFEIEVNRHHPRGKQNFSINHEICHTFFTEYGSSGIKIDQDTGTYSLKQEEEYLCDVGASALLFDSRWFQPRVLELGISTKSIFKLSKIFKGSLEATASALCDLDLCACAVIFWEKSIKPTQKYLINQNTLPGLEAVKDDLLKVRVRLSWHSSSFKKEYFFPRHKSALVNGLVCSCFETQESTRGYETIESSGKQLWMDSVYVPYQKNGAICPRVMTIATFSEKPVYMS